MDVGKRIIELRTKNNISGNKLAQMAGVSQSTISAIELGQKIPTTVTLGRICEALNITLHEFFNDKKDVELNSALQELLTQANRLSEQQLQSLNSFLKTITNNSV